jgi:hypothetical protein
MKYFFSILIFLFWIPEPEEICTCAPVGNWKGATEAEFTNVELVFTGDVQRIEKNGSKYEIVVCEVFKGNLTEGQRISGKNPESCNPIVDRKGQWLFFGRIDQRNFTQNECGLTNHFIEPVGQLPPPPPPDSGIDYEEYKRTWKEEAREIVKGQIKIVRELAQ